jgi:hypothetical protein
MADQYDIKRVHYFNGQFLEADDFTVEQNYHKNMLRAHNKVIHGWGIVEGFEVTSISGNTVEVTDGMAIDHQGRQIIQKTEDRYQTYTLDRNVQNDDLICLRYDEELTDNSVGGCIVENTRYLEKPKIGIGGGDCKVDGKEGIILAKVGAPDQEKERQYCPLRVSGPKEVEVAGNLTVTENIEVTGNLTVTGDIIGAAKSVDGDTYKIVAGTVDSSEWELEEGEAPTYSDVVVDTTDAHFSMTPMYFVTVVYENSEPDREIKSATVHNAMNIGFKVRYWDTTTPKLSINWIAIGK